MMFFGAIMVLVGVGLGVAMLHIARTAISQLPDETALPTRWSEHRIVHLPAASPALRAASRRLRPIGVPDGHELLGLPASTGVRLAGRTVLGTHGVDVADVWDVRSVTRVNDRPHSAAVRIRAVAAVALPASGPTVLVAPRRHFDAMVDAVLPLRDVTVESDAFNRAWRVRASDHAAAVTLLTPALQLALQERTGAWALELCDGLLSVHHLGDRRHPGQVHCLDDLLDTTSTVLGNLDTYLADARQPPQWQNPTDVVVDARPPGTVHASTRSDLVGTILFAVVSLVMTVMGVGIVLSGLASRGS